jgi:hypothetical protein
MEMEVNLLPIPHAVSVGHDGARWCGSDHERGQSGGWPWRHRVEWPMVNMERRRYGRVVLLGSGPDGGCTRWCPAVCRLSPEIWLGRGVVSGIGQCPLTDQGYVCCRWLQEAKGGWGTGRTETVALRRGCRRRDAAGEDTARVLQDAHFLPCPRHGCMIPLPVATRPIATALTSAFVASSLPLAPARVAVVYEEGLCRLWFNKDYIYPYLPVELFIYLW